MTLTSSKAPYIHINHNILYNYCTKCSSKRNVFTSFLKTDKVFALLIFIGRMFHWVGAEARNARSPNAVCRVRATVSNILSSDLRPDLSFI